MQETSVKRFTSYSYIQFLSKLCCGIMEHTRERHNSSENGVLSTSDINHDQLVEPTMKMVQDGSNVVCPVSSSNSISANMGQGYSAYATYANADPYGYNSTSYAAYYNQHQQQPGQYEQQASQYQLQPSLYQQPSSQYQPQANHYPQQPSQCPGQPTQYLQQPDPSYPHHVGAYQNTGAPYQPLSSFQNTGSYGGPGSYLSTYYNPGDYQTSVSYTSSSHGTQTNSWDVGQYATYCYQQYQGYTQDSNSDYSSTSAVASSQYQQHYKQQWEDYYNQSQPEVSCAPGTEKRPVSVMPSVSASVPSESSAQTAVDQMHTAHTPLWNPGSNSSEMTYVQV